MVHAGPVNAPFRYSVFKFAEAAPPADGNGQVITSLDQIKHGKIVITCRNAVPTSKKPNSYATGAETSSGPSSKLPEGKKWFLAPSLTTQAGAAKTDSAGWSKVVYDTVSTSSTSQPSAPHAPCLSATAVMGSCTSCTRRRRARHVAALLMTRTSGDLLLIAAIAVMSYLVDDVLAACGDRD